MNINSETLDRGVNDYLEPEEVVELGDVSPLIEVSLADIPIQSSTEDAPVLESELPRK